MEGLPIGVQLVGQRFDDRGVLRLARRLEAATADVRTRVPL